MVTLTSILSLRARERRMKILVIPQHVLPGMVRQIKNLIFVTLTSILALRSRERRFKILVIPQHVLLGMVRRIRIYNF